MAEGIAVSNYGTELAGATAVRPTNAPAGVTFYDTTLRKLYVCSGNSSGVSVWDEVGNPGTGVADASITVNAENTTANTITLNIQLKESDGTDLAESGNVWAYLSDAATGVDITATAPSGGVAAGTDGSILVEAVSNKLFLLNSETDGDIDLVLTEVGTPTFYLVILLPNGEKVVSSAITFA